MQKAGVRWPGRSGGDSQQQPAAAAASSTSREFIIYSGRQGSGATVLGVGVTS
jgi:hypothetical protein